VNNWDRSNHGGHGASRGKAITIVIPVFPVPPVVEPMCQCCKEFEIVEK